MRGRSPSLVALLPAAVDLDDGPGPEPSDRLRDIHNLTDHERCWRLDPRCRDSGGKFRQRRHHAVLVDGGAAFDHRGGLVWRAPPRDQRRADLLELSGCHEDDERVHSRGYSLEVDLTPGRGTRGHDG